MQFLDELRIAEIVRVISPVTLAMLSADLKSLKTLSTHCFEDVPTSAFHVMKLLEMCLSTRSDVTKAEVVGLVGVCKENVAARGLPPDDDEMPTIVTPELCVFWEPSQALPTVLHTAFPTARVEAAIFL